MPTDRRTGLIFRRLGSAKYKTASGNANNNAALVYTVGSIAFGLFLKALTKLRIDPGGNRDRQQDGTKQQDRRDLDARHQAWRDANPDGAALWDAARNRKLPGDLVEKLTEGMREKSDATRKHSAAVLERLGEAVPYMVGGSADLAGSAAPPILKSLGLVGPGAAEGEDPFAGRNIFYGVREHAMGAITNGIALDVVYGRRMGYMSAAEMDRILNLLEQLGFELFANELLHEDESGTLQIINGLEEFREHLGGELTITLLKELGQGFEVHEMNLPLVIESIHELHDRQAGREQKIIPASA